MLCIVATLSLLLVFSANAGGSLHPKKLTKVAFQSGGFYLYSVGWDNPNGCTRNDAIVLLSSDANYDKAYALLLSAYMSGKSVSGYSDSCKEFDGQTYNIIRGYKYLVVE